MTAENAPLDHEQKRKLDRHFAGGLAWTAGTKWATQLLSWVPLLVLARLLSPADFGIAEMAGTYFLLANVMAEFGVGTAVLHMPELTPKVLGQLHSFSCLLSTLFFGLSVLATPFIADFYHTPQLRLVLLANNFAFFITGFQAVPMGLLQRDMDYRRLSIAEAVGMLLQAGITVLTAWLGWGYWSLVMGAGVGKLANMTLCSIWKHIPLAIPRWKDIRTPVELGRQIAIGRLAWAVYTNSDGVVVGRVLGDSVLGTYRMAMNLASAPAEKISTLLMRTAGPLFANVQSDLPLVRRYFLIMTETLSLTVMPLMVGLAIVAPDAVPLVLGPKWVNAIAPLQWLAAFMILRTMAVLMEQVLVSQRCTKFTMRMSLLNFVLMPVAFYLSARSKGPAGVAACWIVLAPLTILPFPIALLRRIELRYRDYAAVLWPAVACSGAMALGLFALRAWLAPRAWPAVVSLMVQIATGAAIFGAILLVFFRERVSRYVRFLRDLRASKMPAPPAAAAI